MTLLTFLMMNCAFVALDFTITYALYSLADFGIVSARICGGVVAIAAMFVTIWPRLMQRPMVVATVSAVTLIVNCGLFVLLYLRQPMLNWPVLFAITSVAALAFGAAGYRRALSQHT